MKSLWLTVCFVAAVGFLSMAQAGPEEPAKAEKSAADPIRGKAPGEVRDDNGLKMNLVWCPPGFFTMEDFVPRGNEPAAKKDDGSRDDDDPEDEPSRKRQTKSNLQVKVFLSQGYWLGKYEVTQAEWKEVMKAEPWKGKKYIKEGPDFPATFVSWDDATTFCRKLTEQGRQAGRLPKDWEYTLPTRPIENMAAGLEPKPSWSKPLLAIPRTN